MINSLGLGYTVFAPRVSEVGKIQPFRGKNCFLVNLEAPSMKTVHLQELVMIFKVVVNNILISFIPIKTLRGQM